MPDLIRDGFCVVPGPFAETELAGLTEAYDRTVATADPAEVRHGSTTLRVGGLVNGERCFVRIFTHPPLLAAARDLIGASFKLSAFHIRSLSPGAADQGLHQDFAPLADGWPMVGFILMVDAFSIENGATRFLAGSQSLAELPADSQELTYACGPAGSMILFNGSVWHGHGTNRTASARRSIQGALIRRDQTSAVDHARLTRPDVSARLSPVARELLCLDG